MNCMRYFALLILLVAGTSLRAQDAKPLKLVATIPLPGLHDGDFDHFAPDIAGHRLFLTAEENGKVEVLDIKSNTLLHTIEDLKAPHSIVYRPDLKKLFIVDGDASEIKIYDSETYKMTGAIKLLPDADSMAYDPKTEYMYVVNGGREAHAPFSMISVVDTNSDKKLRDIKVDSNRVEALALETSAPRMFCNITGENKVGVIDREKSKVVATWALPAGEKQNVSMAFDESHHRLFVVTRLPGRLIVLDSETGKFVTSLPAVGFVDDAAFDPKDQRIYLAGDQFVDVFQEKDPDHYALLARIPGSFRAKTALLLPELGRYYLAVPHHGNQQAEVRVFEIQH